MQQTFFILEILGIYNISVRPLRGIQSPKKVLGGLMVNRFRLLPIVPSSCRFVAVKRLYVRGRKYRLMTRLPNPCPPLM